MKIDYKDIGNRVRGARENQKLSQQTLAELSDLMTNSISHIETGNTKVSLPSIINIANALNVPIEQLLCGVTIASKTALSRTFTDLLEDCNNDEIKALFRICKSAKSAIRENIKK